MKATHQHVGLVAAVVIALVIVAYFALNPSHDIRPGVRRSLQIPGKVQLLPYFSRLPVHIHAAPRARAHAPTR
jgi:hypothetical protein